MKEVVLVNFKIVNNDYQQDSRIPYTLIPNKSFGKLLDTSPKNNMHLIQNFYILKYGFFLSKF